MFRLISSCYFILLISELIKSDENTFLKCNFCMGSFESDCANNVTSAYGVQTCNAPYRHNDRKGTYETEGAGDDQRKIVSSCVVLYNNDTKWFTHHILRGCSFVYENVDTCNYILKYVPGVMRCSSCNEDLCN